jgi:hypothetical protein
MEDEAAGIADGLGDVRRASYNPARTDMLWCSALVSMRATSGGYTGARAVDPVGRIGLCRRHGVAANGTAAAVTRRL